jgi:hypothetical protein
MEKNFVHWFNHATLPLSNVFRNCAYYWTFGAYIAYYMNHPLYTPVSDLQMKIGLICQVSNFYCHLLLRNLCRPNGNGGYQIPRGFLFNIVTCKLHNRDLSMVGLQHCNSDFCRMYSIRCDHQGGRIISEDRPAHGSRLRTYFLFAHPSTS